MFMQPRKKIIHEIFFMTAEPKEYFIFLVLFVPSYAIVVIMYR